MNTITFFFLFFFSAEIIAETMMGKKIQDSLCLRVQMVEEASFVAPLQTFPEPTLHR